MALVVFLRGVNVGRHKRFQPAQLARELPALDIVSIGAAGTFVVRAPVSQATILAALRKRLTFDAHILICRARDLVDFVETKPFGTLEPAGNEAFFTIMSRVPRAVPPLPLTEPPGEKWQVKVVVVSGRFVASRWRRQPGRLIYPNQVIEKSIGVATTRNWNTVMAICATLSRPITRV